MWRPEGWQNSWNTEREYEGMVSKAEIYEAGADAMLEALSVLSKGRPVVLSVLSKGRPVVGIKEVDGKQFEYLRIYSEKGERGRIVFISEEGSLATI